MYRVVTLGTIDPVVIVSTRRMNGMMDSTLWCDENGMNQCTTRLCAQTRRTRILMGRTQSIKMNIECA
jgi:hypothetical protein